MVEENVVQWVIHFRNMINANGWDEGIAKCHLHDSLMKMAHD